MAGLADTLLGFDSPAKQRTPFVDANDVAEPHPTTVVAGDAGGSPAGSAAAAKKVALDGSSPLQAAASPPLFTTASPVGSFGAAAAVGSWASHASDNAVTNAEEDDHERTPEQWVAHSRMPPMPPYEELIAALPVGTLTRTAVEHAVAAVRGLGDTMKLGQHFAAIEEFAAASLPATLEQLREFQAPLFGRPRHVEALSTLLTCLEQSYHWPRLALYPKRTTPVALRRAIVVTHGVLEALIGEAVEQLQSSCIGLDAADACLTVAVALGAVDADVFPEGPDPALITVAEGIFPEAGGEREHATNLFFRSGLQDVCFQGSDETAERQRAEFGAMEEVVKTFGMQRAAQDVFEEDCLEAVVVATQLLYAVGRGAPLTDALVETFTDCLRRVAIYFARFHKRTFLLHPDEYLWYQSFVTWGFPVEPSTQLSGGADTVALRVLTVFCGYLGDVRTAEMDGILKSSKTRSMRMPKGTRDLMDWMGAAPYNLRGFVQRASSGAEPGVSPQSATMLLRTQAVVFEQFREFLEMHRKKACRKLVTHNDIEFVSKMLRIAAERRFGETPEFLPVTRWARVATTPESDGEASRPYFARIRIHFEDGVLVGAGPGDRLQLILEDESDNNRSDPASSSLHLQPRTYSICWVEHDERFPLLARSIDISVRNTGGRVSGALCCGDASSMGTATLRARVVPGNHFDLRANEQPEQECFMFAQGVAAGAFLGWLEDGVVGPFATNTTQPPGKYTLVVGIRHVVQLPYRAELAALVARHPGKVEVVIAVGGRDEILPEGTGAAGLRFVRGRADAFARSLVAAGRISGSAWRGFAGGSCAFGASLAEALRPALPMSLTGHIDSTRTARVPMDVYSPPDQAPNPTRAISLAELQEHCRPDDLWTAYKGHVFDLTAFLPHHPGGQKTLQCTAGLVVDEVFDVLHGSSEEALSVLRSYRIGTLTATPEEQDWAAAFTAGLVDAGNTAVNASRFFSVSSGKLGSQSNVPPMPAVLDGLHRALTKVKVLVEKHESDVAPLVSVKTVEGVEQRLQAWDVRAREHVADGSMTLADAESFRIAQSKAFLEWTWSLRRAIWALAANTSSPSSSSSTAVVLAVTVKANLAAFHEICDSM